MKEQKSKPKRNRRGSRKSQNPLRHVPSYLLWALVILIIIIYSTAFYKMFVTPYSFRWKALYGSVTYPNAKVRGLDVSHYQGEIDWEKLRNAQIQDSPVRFVFIKATEGVDIFDEYFNRNFHEARKSRIIRGAYHFFSTSSSPERQARFFCNMVQLEDEDLPPVLDIETNKDGLSPQELRKMALRWLQIVEKHYGMVPILYTNLKFKTTYLSTLEFDRYPYWIAHYYVEKPSYDGKWTFWQHTDVGRVDGIDGTVDVNIFNGSFDDLYKLTKVTK